MAEIRWTQEAVAWLEDIYRYIAQDNRQAAQRVVNAIYERAQLLKAFPLLGHMHRSEAEGEIRILFYGHYRIAYFVRDPQVIEVLGVFHSALDIDRYL